MAANKIYINVFLLLALGIAPVSFAQSNMTPPVAAEVQDDVTLVSDIIFKGVTLSEESELRRFIKLQSGKPLNLADVKAEESRLRVRFKSRGFRKASVVTRTSTDLEQKIAKVYFEIKKGKPCVIAEVRVEPRQSLLAFLSSAIEPGSICDLVALKDTVEREKNRLHAEGYLTADVSIVKVEFSSAEDLGVVFLRVHQGPKTRIEVVNIATGGLVDDLFETKDEVSPTELLYLTDEEVQREILNDFLQRGYSRAIVTGPTRLSDGSENIIRFVVQPGPQVYIGEITFSGEIPLSRERVLEKLDINQRFFSRGTPFVEADLENIRKKLELVFAEHGYDKATVGFPIVALGPDGRKANLEFKVIAGDKYFVKDITILGIPEEFTLDRDPLDEIFSQGNPYTRTKVKSYVDEIRVQLWQKGYLYADSPKQAQVTFSPGKGDTVDSTIVVQIDAGPQVVIGKIFAEGDLYTKEISIISESGLKTGEIYTPLKRDRARQRLLQHNLFSTVDVKVLTKNTHENRPKVVDLVIQTQGRPSYTLGLGPGWGSLKGYRFGVDYTKNNLTANGLRFFSGASISQEKDQTVYENKQFLGRQMTFGISEPLLKVFNYPTPLDATLSATWGAAVQPLYNRVYNIVQPELAYRPYFFEIPFTFQSKFVFENSQLASNNKLPPIDAIENSTTSIHELVLTSTIDTRNNREWPTGGGFYEASYSMARFGFLSDIEYDRANLDLSYFFPLHGRLSAAVSAGGLKMFNISHKNEDTVTVPGSRRTSLQGKSQVRGFREGDVALGPLIWLQREKISAESSCPHLLEGTGATNVLYLKGELRYRSPWLGNSLGFAQFIDSGIAYFGKDEENSLKQALNKSSGEESAGCKIISASLVGNDVVKLDKDSPSSAFTQSAQDYFSKAYASAGVGVRVIISNFAALSLDWGIPIRDPAEKQSKCISPSQATQSNVAPECVYRSRPEKYFGVIPGAFHISLGANF